MRSTSGDAQARATQAAGVGTRNSGCAKAPPPAPAPAAGIVPESAITWDPRSCGNLERRNRFEQRTGRLIPVSRRLREQAQQYLPVVGELRRNLRQIRPLVLVDHFHGGRAGVGFSADQHLVEHDTQAVQIAARVDFLGMSLFWA